MLLLNTTWTWTTWCNTLSHIQTSYRHTHTHSHIASSIPLLYTHTNTINHSTSCLCLGVVVFIHEKKREKKNLLHCIGCGGTYGQTQAVAIVVLCSTALKRSASRATLRCAATRRVRENAPLKLGLGEGQMCDFVQFVFLFFLSLDLVSNRLSSIFSLTRTISFSLPLINT